MKKTKLILKSGACTQQCPSLRTLEFPFQADVYTVLLLASVLLTSMLRTNRIIALHCKTWEGWNKERREEVGWRRHETSILGREK